jgi:hypothetical protein
MRACGPLALRVKAQLSASPVTDTSIVPPRGTAPLAIMTRLRRSLTLFFGNSARGALQVSAILSSPNMPRATPSASPRSMEAPAEPAAPKASRANCSRAEAWLALLRIRSRAKSRMPRSSSSSTSSPFTMAPTGDITSWQTREQRSAARSSGSRVTAAMPGLREQDARGLAGDGSPRGDSGTKSG